MFHLFISVLEAIVPHNLLTTLQAFFNTNTLFICMGIFIAIILSFFIFWPIRSQKKTTVNVLLFMCLGLVLGITTWNVYHNNGRLAKAKQTNHQDATNLEKRTVTVTHHIDDDVLGYKHWTGTYHPTTFVMHANNVCLDEKNKDFKVEIIDNTLEIRFDYAFLNGKRKGAKIVSFDIPTGLEHCDINFDWKDDWQVLIDGADPIDVVKQEFNENLNTETKQ